MIPSYILIIGAMKSGTTTLFDALSRHSAIAPCSPKEPGFFAFEEIWAQGFGWYESLFSFEPKTHRFALDGSTDYTKRPFCDGIVERLSASAPRDFHLIYIMRDPIKRIESHARHTQYTKREIGRFPSPKESHGFDAGISPVNLAVSRYAYQLEPYRSFYDQGRLYLTTLETLEENYESEIGRILSFLGLQSEATAIRSRHSNKAEEKRRATWLSNRLIYSRYLSFLAPAQRKKLAFQFMRKVELTGRFQLNTFEREALIQLLRNEVRKLHSEYGFSPPCEWLQNETILYPEDITAPSANSGKKVNTDTRGD